jgi:hypothetical protein
MKWFKVFFRVALCDLKIVPVQMKVVMLRWRVQYADFRRRKLYIEKSIPFILLLLPSLFLRYCADGIRAHLKRMSVSKFREDRCERDEAATRALKAQTNQMRVETMGKFADLFPGATVNDWDAMLNNRTPVSIRFLIALMRSKR